MNHRFEDILPRRPVPKWLSALSEASELPKPIPLKDVLTDSCYYPSAGLDASPIIILSGFIHSFVYVDYSIERERFLEELNPPAGFSQYECILSRDIEKKEIVPSHWVPHQPEHLEQLEKYKDLEVAQPFCHWSIWRRTTQDIRHGSSLFSLLFISGEGVSTYQGLYYKAHVAPKACAIIQPGHGFGNNWTNFYDPKGPFWQMVSAGPQKPDCLLLSSWASENKKCPFNGYRFLRRTNTFTSYDRIHTLIYGPYTKKKFFGFVEAYDGHFNVIDIFEREEIK